MSDKWNATDYEKNSSAQMEWAKEMISKLDLKGVESVLDIGCGDGKVTATLAGELSTTQSICSVIGIDSSESMLRLADEKFPHDKYPDITFMKMDAASLLFADKFDLVFSNAALHWIKDHKPLIKGIYKALKPGGRIYLQMGGRGNAEDLVEVIDQLIAAPQWRQYFENFQFPYGFYGPEEYRQWLSEQGFTNINAVLLEKNMVQQGTDGFKGWIRTTWHPYTNRVPETMQDEFMEQAVSNYLKKFPADSNGNVTVKMMRLEVKAAKMK